MNQAVIRSKISQNQIQKRHHVAENWEANSIYNLMSNEMLGLKRDCSSLMPLLSEYKWPGVHEGRSTVIVNKGKLHTSATCNLFTIGYTKWDECTQLYASYILTKLSLQHLSYPLHHSIGTHRAAWHHSIGQKQRVEEDVTEVQPPFDLTAAKGPRVCRWKEGESQSSPTDIVHWYFFRLWSTVAQTHGINNKDWGGLEHLWRYRSLHPDKLIFFLFSIDPQPLEKHFSSCQNMLAHTHTYPHIAYKNKIGTLNPLLCCTHVRVSVCRAASIHTNSRDVLCSPSVAGKAILSSMEGIKLWTHWCQQRSLTFLLLILV